MHGSVAITMEKLINMLTFCQEHFMAKLEQEQDMLAHSINANRGNVCIYNNHMFKTSLLKYPKTSMDLTVASSLHGIKIIADKRLSKIQSLKRATSRSLDYMLVLLTT